MKRPIDLWLGARRRKRKPPRRPSTILGLAGPSTAPHFAPIRVSTYSMALRRSDMLANRSAGSFFRQRWTIWSTSAATRA